ncbi:hypothetical protein [Pseudomonas sp. A34-9]|uniref:hypothetical protein n=1 Tax=Pseudomonas sp. A34-9 TaxID=3034675 RepID=UPI00240CE966|nr:hypothetical protein [Pseudomonas sp. A34-9]
MPEEFSDIKHRELDVKNIVMRDGTRGRLKFSMPNRKWMLDSNKYRDITYDQLKVVGRCNHQAPDMFKLSLPDN